MALGKQAKVLSKQQIDALYLSLSLTRDPERNRLSRFDLGNGAGRIR